MTRDGKYLAIGRAVAGSYQLWVVRADGSGEEVPIVQGAAQADELRFSPTASGCSSTPCCRNRHGAAGLCRAVPATGGALAAVDKRGVQPRWRADGTEVFYLDPTRSSDARRAAGRRPSVRLARPKASSTSVFEPSALMDQFEPIGRRASCFVIRRPIAGSSQDLGPVHVLLNWRKAVGLN